MGLYYGSTTSRRHLLTDVTHVSGFFVTHVSGCAGLHSSPRKVILSEGSRSRRIYAKRFVPSTNRKSLRVGLIARGRGSCSSSSTRTGDQRLVSRLESCDYLLTRDAWKMVEKLVEAVPMLDVVDQVAQRRPRSHEHRRAAENLR